MTIPYWEEEEEEKILFFFQLFFSLLSKTGDVSCPNHRQSTHNIPRAKFLQQSAKTSRRKEEEEGEEEEAKSRSRLPFLSSTIRVETSGAVV